jgi:hypothetical protein
MRVKMLVGLSGPAFTLSPGDVYECDDSEGTRLICARYAVPHVEDNIERAVAAPAPEKRTRKKG